MAMASSTMLVSSFTAAMHRTPYSRNEYSTTKKVAVEVRCSLGSTVQSPVVATAAAVLLLFSPIGEVTPYKMEFWQWGYEVVVYSRARHDDLLQVALAGPGLSAGSLCEIAAEPDAGTVLNLGPSDSDGPLIMSGGMGMKNFNPARYAGRWYEVASLKLGFAGQGQEDCHCTQGIYSYNEAKMSIEVETFCVHGSPTGYITGIRGRVQCVTDKELAKLKISEFERKQMVQQKCYLRFPNLPFIPRQPYNVLDTDYDNYALVSGAKDASFIQIYSRIPNPGREFVDTQKAVLAKLGYDAEDIRDTPQDCEETSVEQLEGMMAKPDIENVLDNTFLPQPLGLKKGVELNPFTSSLETIKKLIQLYLPKFN